MGLNLIKWQNKLKNFNENLTNELYLKILNEKNNQMKRVRRKGFLLMRDNSPSYISNKTTEIINNIKMKECKDWSPYSLDLNQIKNIRE